MRFFKHWKAILAVVLVFAAGAVVGSVATMMHLKHAFEQGLTVEKFTAKAMEHLQKDLALTPAQQPKIRAIVDKSAHQVAQSLGQAIRESGTNLVASWNEIDKELTPEQRVIFQRKCQKFREGLKKAMKIDLPPQ
jgi:Spy/CpxP family protein refolding chaperone